MSFDRAQKGDAQEADATEPANADAGSNLRERALQRRRQERKNGDGDAGAGQPKSSARQEIERQVVAGVMAAENCDLPTATKIKDDLIMTAGETLGVAELLGLRFPVKAYEAQVSSELYRGARVDGKGMAALKAQGIHGIVSFCMENDDDTKPAEALGLKHLRIPMLDNGVPTEGQVKEFVQFIKNGENAPVYCHCEAGKGRTGTMVACYRIAVQGWSAEQAIAEGKTYGLQLINQIEFIKQFAADVSSGKFAA